MLHNVFIYIKTVTYVTVTSPRFQRTGKIITATIKRSGSTSVCHRRNIQGHHCIPVIKNNEVAILILFLMHPTAILKFSSAFVTYAHEPRSHYVIRRLDFCKRNFCCAQCDFEGFCVEYINFSGCAVYLYAGLLRVQ